MIYASMNNSWLAIQLKEPSSLRGVDRHLMIVTRATLPWTINSLVYDYLAKLS